MLKHYSVLRFLKFIFHSKYQINLFWKQRGEMRNCLYFGRFALPFFFELYTNRSINPGNETRLVCVVDIKIFIPTKKLMTSFQRIIWHYLNTARKNAALSTYKYKYLHTLKLIFVCTYYSSHKSQFVGLVTNLQRHKTNKARVKRTKSYAV